MTAALTDEQKKARKRISEAARRERIRQRRLSDPEFAEEWRRKQRAKNVKDWAAVKADPERLEKERARNVERRTAIKADPEMLEKERSRYKINQARFHERIRQKRLTDPEYDEKYRRWSRARNVKRFAKIKADPLAYAQKLRKNAEYKRIKRRSTARSDLSRGINPALRDSTYAALFSLVSPGHPERDDLISEAFVKLLEGEASTPAEALKLGSREHYRKFADRRQTRSLDEKSKFTGMSLYDKIGA